MRDLLAKLTVRLGLYKPIVECINYFKAEVNSRRIQKQGIEMLAAVTQVFEDINVTAFLTYGVLLGAYRDKGFISYDPDIDLGVLYDELPTDLHEKMADAGFQLHHQAYFKESNTVFEETYIYKKLHLDIFYYFKEGNDYYSVIARKHESKEWKEANATDGFPCEKVSVVKTEFQRQNFMNIDVYMPIKTHEWLVDMYSESYMTPIKNWSEDDHKTRRSKSTERSYRKLY